MHEGSMPIWYIMENKREREKMRNIDRSDEEKKLDLPERAKNGMLLTAWPYKVRQKYDATDLYECDASHRINDKITL